MTAAVVFAAVLILGVLGLIVQDLHRWEMQARRRVAASSRKEVDLEVARDRTRGELRLHLDGSRKAVRLALETFTSLERR